MIRKLLIAVVAAGATLGLFHEPEQADARPRVRVYVGPNGTAVRWRGGAFRSYYPQRHYYRQYNRGVTFSYGQPYYGGAYYGGHAYPTYGYGYSYPYSNGGVYYRY